MLFPFRKAFSVHRMCHRYTIGCGQPGPIHPEKTLERILVEEDAGVVAVQPCAFAVVRNENGHRHGQNRFVLLYTFCFLSGELDINPVALCHKAYESHII
jgi:hypothetical protein